MPKIIALFLSLFLVGCVTVAEKERIAALPMYGQPEIPRDAYLKTEDESFIRQMTQRYQGDRRRAAAALTSEANEQLRYGDADGAMARYNRAWLLDPEFYQVYWGFGQVLAARGEFEPALRQLATARVKIDDDFQLPALLTDLATAHALAGEGRPNQQLTDHMEQAEALFNEALAVDPDYQLVWSRWALARYRVGDYAGAWERVNEARRRGINLFSKRFLDDLAARLPNPNP